MYIVHKESGSRKAAFFVAVLDGNVLIISGVSVANFRPFRADTPDFSHLPHTTNYDAKRPPATDSL